MAIKNASDLLVYAKTASAAEQVTRIYVRDSDPISLADGETFGRLKVNNITDQFGVIDDGTPTGGNTNSSTSILNNLNTVLVTNNGYTSGSNTAITINGVAYKYRDFTNGAVGLVPTLEIVDGTIDPKATINEGAIIIEIVTPGSSAIFDPVAYSTSASFSTNMDLRDVTNKDSNGWSESLGGLRSFEVSTDILQSINPDVPLDGTDFFDKLKNRSLVDLSFSDRIRNIIRTNLTQSGVDGFLLVSATQTNLQTDDFGGSTASKIFVGNSNNYNRLQYTINPSRVEDKTITWTLYVKADTSSSVSLYADKSGGAAYFPNKIEVLEGDYTTITNQNRTINGLSTSSFTRIRLTYNNLDASSATGVNFMLFPGSNQASQSIGDSVITSSWQIELSPEATDYQDPTDITHWQGNALVSSLSFDAGVEDNLTCSATFTGTGNIYPNGLGPELIADTGFDDSSYWGVFGDSVIENGYGKVKIGSSGTAGLNKTNIVVAGDYYLLTYTIPSASPGTGSIQLEDADSVNINLPKSVGTHKIQYKAGDTELLIKRGTNPTDIWLSSISLKKIL